MHPTVAALMLSIGREFELRRVRVPAEPPVVLAACGNAVGAGARAMFAWSGVLRRQVARAGMTAPDAVFGIAWSGGMTRDRLLQLLPHLPDGESEVYCHPASRRDALLDRLMPAYDHAAELAALCDPAVRAAAGRLA